MCKKIFNESELDERNYNFIVSNVILSQTDKFTYNDILQELSRMFENVTDRIQTVVKKCLIRLRDDGFLSILGSNYSVVEVNI
jgi:DNA-directed RNA polymerase delta subunit